MLKYPHQFVSEANGLIAVVAAGAFVFLFNSYRMGKLSKAKAILLGAAALVLIVGALLIFGK